MSCGASERTPMITGKRRLLAVCVTLLAIAWMGVIFAFSSQPDTESSEVSGRVSYQLVEGWNTALITQNTVSHTTVPITLKDRCTIAARFAFLLAPTEETMAVTQVPIF